MLSFFCFCTFRQEYVVRGYYHNGNQPDKSIGLICDAMILLYGRQTLLVTFDSCVCG